MVRRLALALMFLAAACGAPAPAPPAPPPRPVPKPQPPPPPAPAPAGPLAVTFTRSRTAQVFHIVDELSAWYSRKGMPYVAWAAKSLPLDDAERELLARHAKLRAMRRWGALDQAFYVDAPIDDAMRAAVEKKLLALADAEAERHLLDHFATRLDGLVDAQATRVESFEASAKTELARAATLLAELGRFCEVVDPLPIRVALVADPEAEGTSRLHGNLLVVEVSGDDALPTFLHELSHAVLMQRRSSIAIAAGRCDESIDEETLHEGLAYAFAPGLVHPAGRDLLREMVTADEGRSLRDPFVRYERLGLAVRADLESALGGGRETIGHFLPKACDAWGSVAKP